IRRHFEELGPDHRTYGVAGFFGVAMQYVSLDEPNAQTLAPPVASPTQLVRERAVPEHEGALERRQLLRKVVGWLRHEVGDASRSMARGVVLTPLVGLIAALPLAARVLLPRLAQRVADALSRWLAPSPRTRLALARPEAPRRRAEDGAHEHREADEPSLGFTL